MHRSPRTNAEAASLSQWFGLPGFLSWGSAARRRTAGARAGSSILLGTLAVIAMAGLAGCGGSSSISKSSTPQVTVAITKAAPATMALSTSTTKSTATIAATVSNDKSGSGVVWTTSCSFIFCGSTNLAYSGTAASGADVIYTAPTQSPGGSVTLTVRSVANKEAVATTTVTLPANDTLAFTEFPSGSITANTSTSIEAYATGVYGNDSIVYSVSCASTLTGGCGHFGTSGTSVTNDNYSGDDVSYTAPATVPSDGKVTITATLADDAAATVSATIPISAAPVSPVEFEPL